MLPMTTLFKEHVVYFKAISHIALSSKMFALHVLIVCLCVPLISGICPTGCTCTGSVVSCSKLNAIPEELPLHMTSFSLSNPNISTLLADSFLKYKKLRSIVFSSGSIDEIANCAFRNIPAQTIKLFSYTIIGTIQSGAFRELDTERKRVLQFQYGKITTIKPYAFYNLTGLQQLTFSRIKIQSLESYAIHQIKYSYSFSIEYADIVNLKSYALDLPQSFQNRRFYQSSVVNIGHKTLEIFGDISSLTTWCNCDVIKLIQKGVRLNNPIKCIPETELGNAQFGTQDECERPTIPLPAKLPVFKQKKNSGSSYRTKSTEDEEFCNSLQYLGLKDALSCLKINLKLIRKKFGMNLGLLMNAK